MIYRLHITCDAGHTTYTDYKTKKSADKNLLRGDHNGWIPTCIEVLERPEHWKKINGMWELVK